MAEDKISNLYKTFVNEGYEMEPEEKFRQNLNDPKRRRAAYDALVSSGYEMEPYGEFERNIGYGGSERPLAGATGDKSAGAASRPQAGDAGNEGSSGSEAGGALGDVFRGAIAGASGLQAGGSEYTQADKPAGGDSDSEDSEAGASGDKSDGWGLSEQEKIRRMYELKRGVDASLRRLKESKERSERTAGRSTAEGRRTLGARRFAAELAGAPTKLQGWGGGSAEKNAAGEGVSESGEKETPNVLSPEPYGVRIVDGRPVTEWLMPDGSLTTDLSRAEATEHAARENRALAERMRVSGLDFFNEDDRKSQSMIDAIITGSGLNPEEREKILSAIRADGLDPADPKHVAWAVKGEERKILEFRLQKAEENLKELNRQRVEEDNERARSGGWLNNLGHQVGEATRAMHPTPRGSHAGVSERPLDRDIEYATAEVTALRRALDRYDSRQKAAGLPWYGKIAQGLWDGLTDANSWAMYVPEMSVGASVAASTRDNRGHRLGESWARGEQLVGSAANPGALYEGAEFFGEMMKDPLMYFSGAIGGGAERVASRAIARGAAKGMTKPVAERFAMSSVVNRIASKGVGGGVNFGLFDGLRDARQQMIDGGWTDSENRFHEGFSLPHVLKKGGYGLVMGLGMGIWGAGIGNAGDWLVTAPGAGAVVKTSVRAGQHLASFGGEALIFAMPEIYEFHTMKDGEFDELYADKFGYADEKDSEKRAAAREEARESLQWDAFTQSAAQLAAMKISGKVMNTAGVVRHASEVIDELRGVDANRNMTFAERVSRMMDRSPFDVALSKSDKEELRKFGYDDLADLFVRDEVKDRRGPEGRRNAEKTQGGRTHERDFEEAAEAEPGESVDERGVDVASGRDLTVPPKPRLRAVAPDDVDPTPHVDGYLELDALVHDTRISEGVRAKLYFIATGHMLPMSTIMSYTVNRDADGNFEVLSMSQDGSLVTRMITRDKAEVKEAEKALARQIEMNSVEAGEMERERDARSRLLDIAIRAVRPEWDPETVRRNYAAVKAGEDLGEPMERVVREIDDFIAQNPDAANEFRPEAMRARIKRESGMDVDDALKKNAPDRSEAEAEVVDRYFRMLYPEEAARREAERASAETVEEVMEQPRLAYDAGCRIYEESDGNMDPETAAQVDGAVECLREAEEEIRDLFEDPEEVLSRLSDDPRGVIADLVESGRMDDVEAQAILEYVNARSVIEGLNRAAAEGLEERKEAVRNEVAARTHKDGLIHRAIMKVGDRRVFVVNGDVVMFEDGSDVDHARSSESVVIVDEETGKMEFTSPDQILSVEAGYDPQDELQASYDTIEAEHQAMFSNIAKSETKNLERKGREVSENSVTSQYENGSEQDNGLSHENEWVNAGGSVAIDSARSVEGDRDRSDIRVYESGLGAERNEYSEYSERTRRNAEAERLIGIARQQGQYVDKSEYAKLGTKYPRHSGESEVYTNKAEGKVYKIKDPAAKAPMKGGVQPEDAIYEHLVHNKYFPETRYQFEGISDDMGDLRIVLSQGYIDAVDNATDKQIEAALAEKGLMPEGRYTYGNEEITVTDVMGDNALLGADGKVYFIDPIIDFKKPVKEIIGEYNAVPENAESVPNIAENTENPTINSELISESGPNSVNSVENGQETALSRIPVNEAGEPMFEAVDGETGWDGLLEVMRGDEPRAAKIAKKQIELAEAELERLRKKPPVRKEPKLSGSAMAMARAEQAADEQFEKDKAQYEEMIEAAEAKKQAWESILGVYTSRHAEEIRRAEEAEAARRAEEQEWEEVKARMDSRLHETAEEVRDVPEAVEILKDSDPHNMEEAAAHVLMGNKVLLGDGPNAERGVRRFAGMGTTESKKLIGLFATAEKGGKSLEELSETVMEETCAEYGIPYEQGEALDALMSVLSSVETRGDIHSFIVNARIERARRTAEGMRAQWERMEAEAIWEAYHMTPAEFSDYEEYQCEVAREALEDFDESEYNSYIADQLAERAEREAAEAAKQNEYGLETDSGPEPATESPADGRGGEILSRQESDLAPRGRADENGSGVPQGNGDQGRDPQGSLGEAERVAGAGDRIGNTGDAGRNGERAGDLAQAEEGVEPTEAQKAAGNYKMEHRRIDGYNISIENPKGSVRRGKDADGKEWQTEMHHDYGYIRGTEGVDGDHIDVFLSDTPEEGDVFVIDQRNEDGSFDEHKVMYGFPSEEAAREAYLSNYEQGWTGLGAITHVSKDEFKKWIGSSKRKTKPFAEYAGVKAVCPVCGKAGIPNYHSHDVVCPQCNSDLSVFRQIAEFSENDKQELSDKFIGEDNQGNPIDHVGKLIVEEVKSIDEITDNDFTNPSRNVGLPPLPKKVSDTIGAERRKPVIKRNIFAKNLKSHKDLTPEDSRKILSEVLYNPSLYGQNQKANRPYNWILVHLADKHSSVIIEVNPTKEQLEIVNWHYLSGETLERKKRQAIKEGGRILTLSEDNAAADTHDDLSSGRKDNALSADKQIGSAESSEPYTITPTKYEGKRKTSDVWLVKFNRELTAEERTAFDTFVRGPLMEGRKTSRGWFDRKQDGYMIRSEEAARQFGEMIGNEEAVTDAQPLSREDIKQAAGQKPARKKSTRKPANTVSVDDMTEKQEEKPAAKGQFKVTEEMRAQEDELRKLLGIDDEEGSRDMYFRDPDELTPQQKRKVFSLGVNYAFNFLDNGVIAFPDFARAIVGRLGSKVKPFIKSWYEGAKRVPGYGGEGYTETAEVDRFDIENFDKPSPDVIRDAEMRVAERKARIAAEQAEKELIAERNEKRRKDDKQREADTEALAGKAEAVACEAEATAESARDERAVAAASEKVDKTLDKINNQLAILGYFERKGNDPVAIVERKAAGAGADLAAQLVDDLGLKLTDLPKDVNVVSSDFGEKGGYVRMNLPVRSGYEPLRIDIRFDRTGNESLRLTELMTTLKRGDEQSYIIGEDHQTWLFVPTYGELISTIKEQIGKYLPKEESHNGYKRGDEVMWDRYGNGKWEKVKIEDFDTDGSPIFEAVKGIMSEKGDWSRVKPADGIFGEAKRVATKAQEERAKQRREDNQGNPIDGNGKLILEEVGSAMELTDDDFMNPTRNVALPALPENVSDAIGAKGRKPIIKRNVFIKNRDTHKELSAKESRDILNRALYNPNIVGETQPIRRPDYKVAIQTGDKNAVVVLDVYAGKDNVEIVGWRKIDAKGLEKMKRQSEREGGQFLILSPVEGSAAALSALPSDVSSAGKVTKKKSKKQIKSEQMVGDLFGGLFDEPIKESNHEETEMGTRPGETGGQRQQFKQDPQVGGDEPRGKAERPSGKGGGGDIVMDSDADRAGGRGVHDVAAQPALERLPEKERRNVHNNRVERGTEVAPKSESARIKANIAAIETMKKLEASGETPSTADMEKLRAFSGWGGLGRAFSDREISYQLRQLLGSSLYDEGAEMSRNSAYFTPAYIVDAMWDIARAMGFKGGRVLEGSAGIGNILGLMPQDLSERSDIRAVEKDPTTGKMLRMLYPDAVVDIDGFEKVKVETGTYDLVITNVPFIPGLKVADTSGDADISKEFRSSIHDFCIAKNVRKLRDGGVGVFITTAGSMDGTGRLYKWLGNRENADIVGLFRMHNETFGGTNATSDIIVVRKRVNGIKSSHAIDCSLTTGVRLAEYNTGETKKVKGSVVPVIKTLSMSYNRYFVEHPEYMAGEMHFGFEKGDTGFRPESRGLYPSKDQDQPQLLRQWVEDMREKLADASESAAPIVMNHRDEYVPNYDKVGNEVKTGTVVVDSQGRICVNYDGVARPLMSKLDNKNPKSADARIEQFNKNKVKGRTRSEVVEDYNAIKKALNDLLEYQKRSKSDEGLQPRLKALNRVFDSFVATYGHLHGNNGLAWLKNDVDYPSVLALETYREEGLDHKKVYGKADIFSRRVVVRPEIPKATNVRDGVTLSIRQTGTLNIPFIADQLDKSEADVRREVIETGLGYENPLTHSIEAAHEYLSGNVREKLQQAEANNEDGRYALNITALRKVVPHSIPSHFIEFSIGSSWLRPELFKEYVKERTGTDVELTYAGGMWVMDKPRWAGEQNKSFGIRSEICDKVITGTELIEAAMTNRTIRVSKQQKDGPTISDPKATSACAAKVDEIRDDFKSWLRSRMESDPELAKEIEETYNNIFNSSAPMVIPAEYIPEYFEGAARVIGGKNIKMREHQAKAIVRGTMQSLMLAHEVGTGKTFTLITTAMEMRRLGTAKKPMIVVQNATLGQFVASAKALYPDARILSLEDRDRNAEGRKDFYAKIRYNDWDMVVIPQSVLERIPDHPDRERRFIEESIQEKMDVIEAMSKDREAGRAVAALKKDLEGLRDRLNKLSEQDISEGEGMEGDMVIPASNRSRDGKKAAIAKENAKIRAEEMLNRKTDDTLNFDDLGVDAILVDEAHEYKHLGFATAMQRGVKGVDPSYSKKCQGLYLKVKAVQEKSGGRNVIFATGTPISNTAAEVWTFMRYLLPREVMDGHNIWYFDDFVRNFGSIQQMLEFTTQGTYKENNRFAGYSNLPELARIWAGITDTVLTSEAGEVKSQIPELEGGQPTDIYLPQTNGLRAVLKFVRAQLKAYDEMSGQEKKENSHIPVVMYGIAKAAAIDARLVMANAPDDPHSKTNEAVRQTLRSLEDSKGYNGTVAIFADNYQRKNKETGAVEFNLFEDIRNKLIAQGVPAEQIVIMRDGMSDKAKEKVFAQVNAGEIRVILGTTQRLGVGVNIQERLHTLMHIDAPNRPMDYWQRMGRLLRQGNLHKEMGIPVRVIRFGVEDSLDVTAYQRLKTKGAIADAIMRSKDLLANNLENRILEEEGDEFGNITAELSGSQYAMLQNQTEKELRKLQAKQDQHRQHQMYIHRTEPRLRGLIEELGNKIVRSDEILALLEKNPTTVTINGKTYQSRDDMQKVFEAHNKAMAARKQMVKANEPISSTLTFEIGNVRFTINSHVSQEAFNGAGSLAFDVNVRYDVVSRDIDYERSYGDVPLKRIINELVDNVTSGKEERANREGWINAKERNETDLAALLKDKGKIFEHEGRIKELEQKLEEYTAAMQAELKEKEAKYAEMDANVEEADEISFTSEDDGENSPAMSGDGNRYRDGEEMSEGERLQAIRALEPIEVKPNNLSRAELREIYNNLPAVDKDGREIEFYHSSFKKIYKDGGLFGQVVPVLDRVLEQSVLAYSEDDNLGGMMRPDGTIHKDHPNTLSFDNYVGKVNIDGMDHYVRITIQHDKGSRNGMHACFVTEVELYENAEFQATGTGNSRVKPYYSGIVDAKLQQFFERAGSELQKKEMERRVTDLSEKLNTPIKVITDRSELDAVSEDGKPLYGARQHRAKGWWDGQTGEIVVVLPNHADVADVENTVVHEIVGHKGLRAFIGEERFDEFLGEVYSHAEEAIRKKIDEMTEAMVRAEAERLQAQKRRQREEAGEDTNATYYEDQAEAWAEAHRRRGAFRNEATEEYLSDLGGRIGDEGFEKMSREELTLWGRVKAKVQEFLDKFLKGLKIGKRFTLTDKDLSYILFKSWKFAKESRDGHSDVFMEAEGVVKSRGTRFNDGNSREREMIRKEAVADRIEDLFNKAVSGDLKGKPVEIGRLTEAGRRYLEKLSGIEMKDVVSFTLNPSDLQHINRRHFGKNEKDGRNIPLTIEDIRSLHEILCKPDKIIYAVEDGMQNRRMFFFLKEAENGSYSLMEVYADRKGNLTSKSFFKSKEGVSQRAVSLKNESSHLTSVTDGATLLDNAKLPKFFEYPKSEGEDDQIRFRDPDMGLEETVTKMKAEAMQANADNLQAKREAMRAIGGNLNNLRRAMARQKEYDVYTVKSVADLARVLMKADLLDSPSKLETNRILSAIKNAVGKEDVSKYADKVMDIMIANQLRAGANDFGRLIRFKGKKTDARGVEVQGQLDAEGELIRATVKKTINVPKEKIDEMIDEAMNRMGNADQTIADNAAVEYSGLLIARRYAEEIAESRVEEKEMRESIRKAKEEMEAGQMSTEAYRQYKRTTEEAIRQNRIERVEAYEDLCRLMGDALIEGVERAREWRRAEKERVREIHHNANSDMEGRASDEHHKPDRVQKVVNSDIFRFIMAPLATFDQMLRMFGSKSVRGEGYLWNRYMRDWLRATENEYTGYKNALKILDAKVKEVFSRPGAKRTGIRTWGDLFSLDRKLPKMTVRFMDGGEMKDHELPQGNLLYIYMVDKMSDGRMKLRKMGITEKDVEDITNFLDPRFIEIADWIQEEFLVEKRNEYNEVYKRMFGTSMAAIDNYFPLKILANARVEEVDVAGEVTDTSLPATSTGSIIKRRRNNLALDIVGANAFSVILDHIQEMERWASFAEFNRDLNSLLSYKRFRNQVMNMSSVYGGGRKLWDTFRKVCALAAGTYRPLVADLDKTAINVAKGVTMACVSFKLFTGLKQFLSMPAYIPDCNPVHLVANLLNPVGAWKWSMKNLPLFEKRWRSRMAGDPRLMKTDMDWKMWRSRVVEIASRIGMSPNAFVDALTVSIGARSMYQTKKAKYLRRGMSNAEAERRAKEDATILFNQTQQSSEGAFLSPMQRDGSWLSTMFTIFRNSSMSYERKEFDSLRNLGHRLEPGYKGISEEFMAKQMRREGIDPETATKEAKREYRRGILRDFVTVGIFGYALQLLWNMSAYLPYMLVGSDDDKKKAHWNDIFTHTIFGSLEGLTGGDIMSAAGNMVVSGEGNPAYLSKDMPLASNVVDILKKMGTDNVSALNDVLNLLVQSGVGVNPQSLTDAAVAILDYCDGDAKTSRECALLIMRVMSCPQSQIDEVYFDEIDMSAREAREATPEQLAERFAMYKMMREAPITGWLRGDEEREEVMAKKMKRPLAVAKKSAKSRMETPEIKQLFEDYDRVSNELKRISELRKTDPEAALEERVKLSETENLQLYHRTGIYRRDMNELTRKLLKATTVKEKVEILKAMDAARDAYLRDVEEIMNGQ